MLLKWNTAVHTPTGLTNLDAELISTAGWVVEEGDFGIRSSDPTPYQGTQYFFGGTAAVSTAYYRVPLTAFTTMSEAEVDGGSVWTMLTWQQASWHPDIEDYGGLGVRFLNSSLTTISTAYSSLIAIQPELSWDKRRLTVLVPPGTRYLDIMYTSTRTSGSNNDTYVDAISISLLST